MSETKVRMKDPQGFHWIDENSYINLELRLAESEKKLEEAKRVVDEIRRLEISDFEPVHKYQTAVRNKCGVYLSKEKA